MAKYRKKPVVVEAELYRPGIEDGFDPIKPDNAFNCDLIIAWRGTAKLELGDFYIPYIFTLEGKHYIMPGDYIITGIQGERYPCKPDIFTATYELVEE